jgi:arylsulfatase A-like enzyme
MTDRLPNILLVMSDQQRTDTLGFRGQTPCRTPNMDRIAREGISFDQALCASPLCMPSRAAIFSGKYPHQLDLLTNSGTLQEPPILTDVLRRSGYYTAYAGKWHLEPPGQPKAFLGREKELGLDQVHGGEVAPKGERIVDRWFDRAEGQESYDYSVWCEDNGLPDGWPVSDPDVRTHRLPSMSIPRPKRQEMDPEHTYDSWVTNIALRFLRERPKEKPFFLVSSYFGPHPPFLIPEPYYSMYDPVDIPEPPNFGPQPDRPRANLTSYYHQLWKDHGESWDSWKKSTAVYWGYCTLIDDLLGKLLRALGEENILDETLVIYLSDHGEMLGSHGLWQKMVPYEESIRVPLLMRLPGVIGAGIRSQANVSLIDLVPTLLASTAQTNPADMMGRDLTPAFQNAGEFQQDAYRFSEHKPLGDWHNSVEWRLVTDNRLKYVWNQGDLDELYDLDNDPYELANLIADPEYAGDLNRVKNRLEQWMSETGDPLLNEFRQQR